MLIECKLPSEGLLGCRDLPAESSPHIAGIGGPSYLGRIAGTAPRSAISFGASPSANPVSDERANVRRTAPLAGANRIRATQTPIRNHPAARSDRPVGGRDGRD